MKEINLLPKKHLIKDFFLDKKIILIFFTFIIMLTFSFSFTNYTLSKELESLKSQHDFLQLELKEIEKLTSKIKENEEKLNELEKVTPSNWGTILLEIESFIPLGVTFSGVKTYKNDLILQFEATEIEMASLIVKELNNIDFVESTYLNSIEEVEKDFIFTILCSLKNEVR